MSGQAVSDLHRRPRGSRLQSALAHVGHSPPLWTPGKEILPVLTLLSDSEMQEPRLPERETVRILLEPRHTPRAETVNSNHRGTASGTGDIFVDLEYMGGVLTRKCTRQEGEEGFLCSENGSNKARPISPGDPLGTAGRRWRRIQFGALLTQHVLH